MTGTISEQLNQARELEKIGNPQDGLPLIEATITQIRSGIEPEKLAAALCIKANMLAGSGQYAAAEKAAQEVLAIQEQSPEQVNAQVILGICASETKDLITAEKWLDQAADLARKIGYKRGVSWAQRVMAANVHLIRGYFDLAISTMEMACQSPDEDISDVIWGLPTIKAFIFQLTGDHKQTRRALDELLPLVRPATVVAGHYFYLWAKVCIDESEFEKAGEYLNLAYRIVNSSGLNTSNILVRIEKSRYFRMKDEPANAFAWSEDAYSFAQRSGSIYCLGLALLERAQAAWANNQKDQAVKDLKDALNLFESLGANYQMAYASFLLAAYQSELNAEDSHLYWLKASDLILKGGYSSMLESERGISFPLLARQLKSRNATAKNAANSLIAQLAKVSPPALKIRGLGQFNVWQAQRLIPENNWLRRKSGELFRYLLLQPEFSASREMIMEAIWPESAPSTALDNFHQSTSTLRHILEPDLPDKFPSRYLFVEGEHVSLHLPPGSSVDFLYFEEQMPALIQMRNPDKLQQILRYYLDDLFPLDRYSDWSASRRLRLADLYIRGLLTLGEIYLTSQDYFRSIEACSMVLQRDHWSEEAVLIGMKAYIQLRDIPHAMRWYLDLEKTLQEELGMDPSPDLRGLADSLRHR